jgi:hypothetical protein
MERNRSGLLERCKNMLSQNKKKNGRVLSRKKRGSDHEEKRDVLDDLECGKQNPRKSPNCFLLCIEQHVLSGSRLRKTSEISWWARVFRLHLCHMI